jgi:hypothetical protein
LLVSQFALVPAGKTKREKKKKSSATQNATSCKGEGGKRSTHSLGHNFVVATLSGCSFVFEDFLDFFLYLRFAFGLLRFFLLNDFHNFLLRFLLANLFPVLFFFPPKAHENNQHHCKIKKTRTTPTFW